SPIGQTYAQPFHDEDFIFAHQGFIEDFRTTLCPVMRHFLAPEIEARMQGHTEAEYLFATLLHLLADDDEMSVDQAMAEMFVLLDDWLDELPALLNIIISDGEGLYAARHAVNAECAPLYYNTDDEAFPNGQLIATDPLTDSGFWQPVPEHHMLILNVDGPPELLAL
ncbi:MAG: class II glutamine amidotransferase, partial [Gammaproteobacteria bacterium]